MKDKCKNCGGWKGLHHWKTMQCPFGGKEVPIGTADLWTDQTYQEEDERDATLAAQAQEIKRLRALLGIAGQRFSVFYNRAIAPRKLGNTRPRRARK